MLTVQARPASESVGVAGFTPTMKDHALLAVVQDVIASDGRLTNAALATRLRVSEEAVRKRLARNQPLRAWLNASIESAVDEAWPKVLARATELAMRGSIDHMKFLAQIRGAFKQSDGSGSAAIPVQVVIRV